MPRRNEVSNADDIIDSRDVIARIEELESARAELVSDELLPAEEEAKELTVLAEWDEENGEELKALKELANECEGYGDWEHGETLIRDSYFETYAQELADDVCDMSSPKWPFTCIDWEQAADELKQDYTSVEFDGVTYWMRS